MKKYSLNLRSLKDIASVMNHRSYPFYIVQYARVFTLQLQWTQLLKKRHNSETYN